MPPGVTLGAPEITKGQALDILSWLQVFTVLCKDAQIQRPGSQWDRFGKYGDSVFARLVCEDNAAPISKDLTGSRAAIGCGLVAVGRWY